MSIFWKKEPRWCLRLCVFHGTCLSLSNLFCVRFVKGCIVHVLIVWYFYLLSRFGGDKENKLSVSCNSAPPVQELPSVVKPLKSTRDEPLSSPSLSTAATELAEGTVHWPDQEASLLSSLEATCVDFEDKSTKASKMEHLLAGIPIVWPNTCSLQSVHRYSGKSGKIQLGLWSASNRTCWKGHTQYLCCRRDGHSRKLENLN